MPNTSRIERGCEVIEFDTDGQAQGRRHWPQLRISRPVDTGDLSMEGWGQWMNSLAIENRRLGVTVPTIGSVAVTLIQAQESGRALQSIYPKMHPSTTTGYQGDQKKFVDVARNHASTVRALYEHEAKTEVNRRYDRAQQRHKDNTARCYAVPGELGMMSANNLARQITADTGVADSDIGMPTKVGILDIGLFREDRLVLQLEAQPLSEEREIAMSHFLRAGALRRSFHQRYSMHATVMRLLHRPTGRIRINIPDPLPTHLPLLSPEVRVIE